MTREQKGILYFVVFTLCAITSMGAIFGFTPVPMLIGGLITLLFMVGREIWQYKTKQTLVFEWEDVVEYGMFILFTTIVYVMAAMAITSL